MSLQTVCQRSFLTVFAGSALWLAFLSPTYAQTHGCACVHNETGRQINFRYQFGDGNRKDVHLQGGYDDAICWRYSGGNHSSPPLKFEIDVDMTSGNAWTVYDLIRVQTNGDTCNVVPQNAQYVIKYRPGTNNQFVQVYKRQP